MTSAHVWSPGGPSLDCEVLLLPGHPSADKGCRAQGRFLALEPAMAGVWDSRV